MDVPTLIIWGAKDRWVPVADAFRFQEDIKGAKLEIFENLGHNPMEEAPRATAAVVAAFLANAPLPPQSSAPVEPDADATVEETVQPAVVPEKD
jgi:alpha-beta hydrolase superfamily lysophospholipase